MLGRDAPEVGPEDESEEDEQQAYAEEGSCLRHLLRSVFAETAAWVINDASLAVSRALGYQPNGTTTRAAEGR